MIPAISGAVGPLGAGEWSVSPIGSIGSTDPTTAGGALAGTGGVGGVSGTTGSSGGFAGALSNAIDSLEQTQASATSASQALATGQLADPTQAITAVENASLEMQLASQIRTKAVDAATDIFHTQI
jgi:flagellar hook-basal body complex protein FliE